MIFENLWERKKGHCTYYEKQNVPSLFASSFLLPRVRGEGAQRADEGASSDVLLVINELASGSTYQKVSHRFMNGPQIDQVFSDETNGGILWYLQDRQNSVRDVATWEGHGDSTKEWIDVNHISYDSFGNVTAWDDPSNPVPNTNGKPGTDTLNAPRRSYTGRQPDSHTGLIHYRARWFDPRIGRFISEDPIGFAAGDANLSRYVGNSSPNAVDPSGMDEIAPEFWSGFQRLSELLGAPQMLGNWAVQTNPPVRMSNRNAYVWTPGFPGSGVIELGDEISVQRIVRMGKKEALSISNLPGSYGSFSQELFHAYCYREVFPNSEFDWYEMILDGQSYKTDTREKGEEAATDLVDFIFSTNAKRYINFVTEHIADEVPPKFEPKPVVPPPYSQATASEQWRINILPGHNGPEEKWHDDTEAMTPMNELLYYGTIFLLYADQATTDASNRKWSSFLSLKAHHVPEIRGKYLMTELRTWYIDHFHGRARRDRQLFIQTGHLFSQAALERMREIEQEFSQPKLAP